MDAATLDPQAWPLADADLEPAALGDRLAYETHRLVCEKREPVECDAGCYYWTAGHLNEWFLAGTSVPGEIELGLNVEYPNVQDMDWTVHEPEESA
jgi:hypothetical protein